MNGDNIKRYTADELRNLAERGESRTDVARVKAMSEADVERAIARDPDWQGISAGWVDRAKAVMPRPKVAVNIRLDADLVDQFRASGSGWQTRINAILRAYSEAKKSSAG